MAYQHVIASYLHTQDIASDTWVITHNLVQIAPAVDCWVLHNGVMTNIIPLSVTATDPNTVTVVFSSNRTGYASVV